MHCRAGLSCCLERAMISLVLTCAMSTCLYDRLQARRDARSLFTACWLSSSGSEDTTYNVTRGLEPHHSVSHPKDPRCHVVGRVDVPEEGVKHPQDPHHNRACKRPHKQVDVVAATIVDRRPLRKRPPRAPGQNRRVARASASAPRMYPSSWALHAGTGASAVARRLMMTPSCRAPRRGRCAMPRCKIAAPRHFCPLQPRWRAARRSRRWRVSVRP